MSPAMDAKLPRSVIGVLIGFAAIGSVLLAFGRRDYPQLHTILDTGMTLFTGVLTLLLWDMGARTRSDLSKHLAVVFGVTFGLELIHVLVTVDWPESLAVAFDMRLFLRPVTWPPAAYALPIGIVSA